MSAEIHTIGIASVAPDGSATMQQWTICRHLADELRAALRARYGAPGMDTVATADGVQAAARQAADATGIVNVFDYREEV